MKSLRARLLGEDRRTSLRFVFYAFYVCGGVLVVGTIVGGAAFSVPPLSYLVGLSILLLGGTAAHRNDGLLVAMAIGGVILVAVTLTGGLVVYWDSPPPMERYVYGPLGSGLALGTPVGAVAYVLGRLRGRIPSLQI